MDYKYDEYTLIFSFTMYDQCNNLKLECPDGSMIEMLQWGRRKQIKN